MAQQYKVQRYEATTQNGNKDMLTTASTAIVQGRMMTTASGYVQAATTSTTLPLYGISGEAKASSDTTTTPVLLDFVRAGDLLRWTVDTGTTSQALVGTTCDIASGGGLDVGTDTNHHVRILSVTAFAPARVCDATSEILCCINGPVFAF